MYKMNNCLVDFTTCPKGTKLVNFFPELGSFKEFTNVENEDIIRVAISTADMESPFLRIKDRETMIRSLFGFLGISITTEEEVAFYESILEYKNTEYLDCFGRYLMILHDIDWTEYQSTKQTHDVLTMDNMRPKGETENIDAFVKRRVNSQSHLKNIGQDLKKLEAKIFPDSRAAREFAINEAKKITTYAERFAESNTFI